MSNIEQIYNFDSAANFNLTNTQIDGSNAKLGLVDNTGQIFAQTFDNDTGFTYDNTKAEFTAGVVRQKDQTPTDSVMGIKFDSLLTGNWSKNNLSLESTLTGAPTIVSNKVDLTGETNRNVLFENNDIGLLANTGAIKLKYTPNYSGSPSSNTNIVSLATPSSTNNRITLFHGATGAIRISLNSSTGASILVAYSLPVFNPTAGQEYEIELNWNASAGSSFKVFIDGNLHGTAPASSYTRTGTATQLYVGAGLTYTTSNAYFRSVVLFSTVQHSTSYTPGYTLPSYKYFNAKIDLPAFTYTGLGSIIAVESSSVVEVDSPRYTVAGLYWNGSAFVASDLTYAQASTSAQIIANLPSLNVSGATTVPVSVYFTDSNVQASVDSLSVTVTGQKYSPEGYLEPTQALQVQDVISYAQSATTSVNTNIGICLKLDSVLKYFVGSTLTDSDGTYAQSNTAAEIDTQLAAYTFPANTEVLFRFILQTDVQTETPLLTTATVTYDFGAKVGTLQTCTVYGYLYNMSGLPVSGATVTFEIDQKSGFYKEAGGISIAPTAVTSTTDANGYFEKDLIRSSEYSPSISYKISITTTDALINKNPAGTKITFDVPDLDQFYLAGVLPTV